MHQSRRFRERRDIAEAWRRGRVEKKDRRLELRSKIVREAIEELLERRMGTRQGSDTRVVSRRYRRDLAFDRLVERHVWQDEHRRPFDGHMLSLILGAGACSEDRIWHV